jgi:SAM-dependent methyltransferase
MASTQAALDRLRAWHQRTAGQAGGVEALPPGAVFAHDGHCPVCGTAARFVVYGDWLRDLYLCARCGSKPRERALMSVLQACAPHWRNLRMHESSPGGPSSDALRRGCRGYLGSHYWPDLAPGAMRDGFRCENLEAQTFRDGSFDLVITQDVMEHVFEPALAYREIARTLAPGGRHIFTTPMSRAIPQSVVCARKRSDGSIEHLRPPEYHGNPIDEKGALVTIWYGDDLGMLVERASQLPTTIHLLDDPYRGIAGEFLEVMVSVKPTGPAAV